ncbi:FG-GAP repeat domain-containing protein [Krasilnikoviella flava]|uniref:Repeat domain-containing protein n=1 Tax=Krasilnikoviella flava TaxID=526729 RepID=A0A1T5ISA4_9MICO|nr:FG-GAP-like repeat-containing protein [Krasilnikoviella flava]SKC42051.1 Repeat domain-containing protein [Krasilnikoviella flava]
MRLTDHRRATRLASTLLAAGLVLSAAPQALAADGDDAMTLTADQAQELADRMGAGLYGDAADDGTSDTEDGTSVDAEAGAGAAEAGAEAAPEADVDPTTPVTFTATSSLEGVRGLGVTLPAKGQQYFTLHSLGNVQLHQPDGSTVWQRTNASLYADWGVKPARVWEKTMYPPNVLMGYNAVSPFSPASDAGYDTADLTGDGTPDLVFSAAVGMNPPVGATIPGTTMKAGTLVTVLDGATGATAWSSVYSYASMVEVVDGTLLVANAPRNNQYAPAAETATLTGIRFTAADGVLTPSETWTFDTAQTAAATWGGIADLGDGRVAVSWNQRKTDAAAPRGHTLVLGAADGSVAWQADGDLYGRQLHLDAARGRLVALEQPDTSDAVSYSVVSYDLATGERTVLGTRVNALATAMTVGDAAAGGGTEYVVSESTLDANRYVNAATIRVLSGKDGTTVRWTSTTKRDADNHGDAPSVWTLDVAGGLLVASAQDDAGISTADNPGGLRYGALTAYTSAGKTTWRRDGVAASPMFQQVYRSGGTDYVRVVDQGQNVRTYTVARGKEKGLTPLQGDLSFAQAADLDGDGKDDVVAGGSSHGVWAWTGRSLVTGTPKELWRATVPGEVHDVETGDVNGDGKPEVIVAADTATVVLDGATGTVLTTIDGGGQYIRSVTVADVNGDGKDEVVVPTDALRAYDARGREVWAYAAPAAAGDVVFSDAVTGDGQVYAQYASAGALSLPDAVENGVALDGRTGAENWTADPVAPAGAADGKLHGALLRNAVFASPNIPYADGHAVAYTWIASIAPNTADESAVATPRVVVEIRDGRTGELLLQQPTGGPWSHDNFFIDGPGDPLYALSFGTFRGFGADGADTSSSVIQPLRGVQFITGPGGRRLLAGGTEGGVGAWDPSVLTTGWAFQYGVGSGSSLGGRNYLAVDLDGDGAEEMISLGFDHHGYDRMAQELGSRVLSLDDDTHQMTTFKLS